MSANSEVALSLTRISSLALSVAAESNPDRLSAASSPFQIKSPESFTVKYFLFEALSRSSTNL